MVFVSVFAYIGFVLDQLGPGALYCKLIFEPGLRGFLLLRLGFDNLTLNLLCLGGGLTQELCRLF